MSRSKDFSAHCTSVFNKYLKRREDDLYKFHPQFFFTNEEIKESNLILKRDLTPICIPPSWDLIQKYAGALDDKADGYDENLYEKGERNFVGDQGEAEFLDLTRNLEIGGILIGDVGSQHLLYGSEFKNSQKEDFMLPNEIVKPLKKAKKFQFDFLYFNSQIGLIHIEIKRSEIYNHEVMMKNFEQIAKQRENLKEIFKIFCECIGNENSTQMWPILSDSQSLRIHSGCSDGGKSTNYDNENIIPCHMNDFEQLLEHLRLSRMQNNICRNIFKEEIFRQFIIFLSGYRPNSFISPVQCALQVYQNIFTHHINTINYYTKNKKDDLQNKAKTINDFLKDLKFVKNIGINFGKYNNIYLTEEQMKTIGNFDGNGIFSPRIQIILGPPGSGKSLILMIKMFICGQMEDRKDRTLYFSTENRHHSEVLEDFFDNNANAFCRAIESCDVFNLSTSAIQIDDIFIDEYYGSIYPPTIDKRAMFTMINTGVLGETIGLKNLEDCPPTRKPLFDQITQLRTIFRSSLQIQKYYSKQTEAITLHSGHNFDGVKVEKWHFPNRVNQTKFAEERLNKLITIEGCRGCDIGVFLSGLYEERWTQMKDQSQTVKFYDNPSLMKSLEFPVLLLALDPYMYDGVLFLLNSRAICHLIICNYTKGSK